jgi:hypothetical protein
MMMEKGEFDKWRGHVVCLVGAVCEALAQCKIPEVRLVKEKLITKDQWDRLLSMERYERAQVWSEKEWLNVQVTDECAVWVDFPIVPTACREMGRQRWMETVTTLSRSASSNLPSPTLRSTSLIFIPRSLGLVDVERDGRTWWSQG